MCGRGGIDYDWKTLWDWLQLPGRARQGGLRRLNVAPSRRRRDEVAWTRLPVVRTDSGRRRVDELVWPLVPHWMRGSLPKFATANCRSEADAAFSATVSRKPAFRNAWRHAQRCLVPLSWFYEWDQRNRPRRPWRVLPAADPLLVAAGLWERSVPDRARPIDSFTIITTGPNAVLSEIGHDRAPVLLRPPQFESWLAGPAGEAERLIAPPADDLLVAHPVTRRVNNPEYAGEDLLEAEIPDHDADDDADAAEHG